jgi:DMSO reductase family type II enzyme heme b subunit
MALVLRPAGVTEEIGSVLIWPSGDAPKLDVVYWSSDREGVTEAVAGSFETLAGVMLESAVRYDDGEWTLVVRRPLRPSDVPGAAEIAADGAAVPVAFVAWDGGNGETGRVRSASTWITLATGTPTAQRPHAPSH